ncbi:MFS transporter [uncultured Propionibacterium sp.]|uniref:MFS transporter n=1 Tax=uncultured Propionibacterium sp. TaxID=218066 RepID=UPI00292DC763|nr:MFS transporter [uncultured Propionibacterium sp.]
MASHTDSESTFGEQRRQNMLSLPFVLVGSFLSIFDQFVINVAATPISRDLNPSTTQLEGIVSGYALVYALGLITGGRIGDRFGRRSVYRLGLALFTVTSTFCGVAQSPEQLVVARLAQGVSGAIMVPQVLALIRVNFYREARVRALSWFGVSIGLGQICGQILGGLIPSWNLFHWSWRPIFLLNVPICLTAWLACSLLSHDQGNTGIKLDLVGVALSGIGCILVFIPLLGGRHTPWLSWGIASMATGVIVLIFFGNQQLRQEIHGRVPLIPFRLFDHRGYTLGVLLSIMLYLAIIPFFFTLGLFLQNICNLSPWATGLTFAPIGIGFIIGSAIGPSLMQRFAPGTALSVGTASTTAALLGILGYTCLGPTKVTPSLIAALLVFGFGNGTTLPIITGVVLHYLPVTDAGSGSAVLTTGQQLFGAIGVALTSVFVLADGVSPTSTGAYAGGLIAQTCAASAALACALLLKHSNIDDEQKDWREEGESGTDPTEEGESMGTERGQQPHDGRDHR